MPNINIRFPNSTSEGIENKLTNQADLHLINPNIETRGVFNQGVKDNGYGAAYFYRDYHFCIDTDSETVDTTTGEKLDTTFLTDYNLGTGKFHVSFWAKPDYIPVDQNNNVLTDAVTLVIGFDNQHTVRTNITLARPAKWTWFCFMRDEHNLFKAYQDSQEVISEEVDSNFNLTGRSYIYLGENPNTAEEDFEVNFQVDDIYILHGNVFASFDAVKPPDEGYQIFRTKPSFAIRKKDDEKIYGYINVLPPVD